MRELLTIDEAAKLLKIKRNTPYSCRYRWKIPSRQVEKMLKFKRFDLEAWLELQARPAILGAGK
jgi:excisionase family DNA binding protein